MNKKLKERINRYISGSGAQLAERESSQQPRLEDGSPLPEGMVPSPIRTLDYRDRNQNGIEDRAEGIYRKSDLIPETDFEPRRNIDPGFNRPIPEILYQLSLQPLRRS